MSDWDLGLEDTDSGDDSEDGEDMTHEQDMSTARMLASLMQRVGDNSSRYATTVAHTVAQSLELKTLSRHVADLAQAERPRKRNKHWSHMHTLIDRIEKDLD